MDNKEILKCQVAIDYLNKRLPIEELKLVAAVDLLWEKMGRNIATIILPVYFLSLALLIQILPNPMILVWIAPPVLMFVCLFYWTLLLHKYLRIALRQIEKLRLEAMLDRNH